MTERIFENKTDDVNIKYSYQETVKILSGFYKGYKGKVLGYTRKNNKTYYHIYIENVGQEMLIEEKDLKNTGWF